MCVKRLLDPSTIFRWRCGADNNNNEQTIRYAIPLERGKIIFYNKCLRAILNKQDNIPMLFMSAYSYSHRFIHISNTISLYKNNSSHEVFCGEMEVDQGRDRVEFAISVSTGRNLNPDDKIQTLCNQNLYMVYTPTPF